MHHSEEFSASFFFQVKCIHKEFSLEIIAITERFKDKTPE